ncbi:hypothetical protein SAMN05421837_12161 [Amycolatopsis pretoriensis]|uniref:Uncharacterized protein n=1 Tax=Amycolatopsis pretoriensis TaxID=218821 RepID=A0A1H5RJL0_9PSEU|nr:hypothetical protein SAMN05421837_12161 [Amycolatopsis pretoriensis]
MLPAPPTGSRPVRAAPLRAQLASPTFYGWNTGRPPHGYRAKVVPRPSPVKVEKGKTKSRLGPEGLKGQTITQIAHWR